MVYLDNAATSRYKPKKALATAAQHQKYSANAGRGAHSAAIDAAAKIERTRTFLSEKLGDKSVIFTKNCTEALNLAIFGLELNGEVLVSPMSHNSVLRPLKQLELQGKISLRFLPPSYPQALDYSRFLTRNTRLVAVPHASNVTGIVENIKALSGETSRRGIILLLDAAQTAGHLPLDYRNVDIIAASGHKGLHALQGVGFLAVKPEIKLRPLLYGGTGTTTLSLVQTADIPESFEAGTQNSAAYISTYDAAKWTYDVLDEISEKMTKLTQLTLDGLATIPRVIVYTPTKNAVGIVSFNIAGIPSAEVAATLDREYGIAVRGGLHCAPLAHRAIGTDRSGAVRVSYGYENSPSDTKRLLCAVKEIVMH